MGVFGEHLLNLRTEQGLSQTELAKAAGVSQATISRLETQDECPTDIRILKKIAKVFNRPLTELLPDAGNTSFNEEYFAAFCQNPFCQQNKHSNKSSGVLVHWNSWQNYPASEFNEINFCPCCGEELVKECAGCKRRFAGTESRFCIKCGEKITTRPTQDDWKKLEELYKREAPEDSPPPPGTDDIPF
jgi:transcriptional regulator with XRE-family HTH domain